MLEIRGRASSIDMQKVLWAADERAVPFRRRDLGGPHVADPPLF